MKAPCGLTSIKSIFPPLSSIRGFRTCLVVKISLAYKLPIYGSKENVAHHRNSFF